jgi:hypothetical protein
MYAVIVKTTVTTFDPRQYALDCGWDISCIEATAERGLSDTDVEAIDQWAGVHEDDYDPPSDEAGQAEADAVRTARDARESLLAWCKAKVASRYASQMWRIEKRVANTGQWKVVGHTSTKEEAVAKAKAVLGGSSTGVRVCQTDSPYRTPEVVVGV